MKLTTAMISFQLEQRISWKQKFYFTQNLSVETISVLSNSPILSNHLYIIINDYKKDVPAANPNASYIILGEYEASWLAHKNVCKILHPFPEMDWNGTALFLLQMIGQIVLDFSRLEKEIVILQKENGTISDYLKVLYNFSPLDVLVMDRNMQTLGATTKNAEEYFGVWEDLTDTEQFTDMVFNPEYQTNCQHSGFIQLHSPEKAERLQCFNYRQEEGYIASLIADCGDDEKTYDILRLYIQVLESVIQSYMEKSFSLRKNRLIHELFGHVVTENSKDACADMTQILKTYKWTDQEQHCAVVLCFFDGISAVTSGEYVCNLLESQWEHSFAVTVGSYIYWIINCSKHKINKKSDTFQKLILHTVSSYICRAGISDFFQGLYDIHVSIQQAQVALKLGQKKFPHKWYHMFSDYVLDYILEISTCEYTWEQLCHKGLLALCDYDEIHGTSYVKSLKTYYLCDKNITKAARELFLHRTSLVRQLERIEKIMDIRLDGGYEQDMYLQLSLLLLQRKRKL